MFAVFVSLTVYIIIDVLVDYPENAISVAGLAIYIILFYVFSKNPAKVRMFQFIKKNTHTQKQ
jgi:hypothetical protein